MSNIKQINIPDLGDVEEVEVIEVCVEVGQTVGSEDSIMILETDKAAMEIPASVDGEVKNILINVGDMVKQGMPFVEIETIAKVNIKETKASETIVQETLNTIEDTNKKIPEKTKQNNQPINYKNTSIHSGPATRKLARECGINLLEVKGSVATVDTPAGTQDVPAEALQDEGFWNSVDWGSYAKGAIGLAQLYSAYKQYKEGDEIGAGITAAQGGVNVASAAGYEAAAKYAPWLAAAASLYGSGKAIFSGDLSPDDQAYESAMAAPRAAAAYFSLGASALLEGFARDQWGGTMRKLDNWNKNWYSGPIGMSTALFKQIGSKKSGAQFLRDQVREKMIDHGAIDENWQGTLADGSNFDFGLDGKELKWKELDKIAAAQPEAWNAAVGLLDPMISAYGLKGQKRADVVGWLARAAVSNAGDDSQIAIDNVKHFADAQGLNFDTYQTLMNSFKNEGKITDDQYAQNMAGAERLFDVNLPDADPATIQKPAKGEVARVTAGM